jgi:lactate dehydrogenase-like 2-hydroxyacid dehydrogenase
VSPAAAGARAVKSATPNHVSDIVLLSPLVPIVERTLGDHGLSTARAWELTDGDAGVARLGRTARAVAGTYAGRVDAALLAKFPKLEIVSVFGVGYDSVDVRAAAARGIVVTNTPDVLTEEVADTAMGLLVCTVRELPQAERHLRDGKWAHGPFRLTDTLQHKTVGIFGFGRIGRAVARRCEAFGLRVAYCGRSAQQVPYVYYPSLVALAREVDILIVTAPATAETKNAVNVDVLAALGPRGVLVNVARGSLVDEPALIRALASGSIRAAGLDVFAHEPEVPEELLAMDNVVLLPHVGSASIATRDAMGKLVADNLISWFSGKGALTPVPETPCPRAAAAPRADP